MFRGFLFLPLNQVPFHTLLFATNINDNYTNSHLSVFSSNQILVSAHRKVVRYKEHSPKEAQPHSGAGGAVQVQHAPGPQGDGPAGQEVGPHRPANPNMVAPATGSGQAVHPGQVLREFVAGHLLHVQLLVRHVCAVGQGVAVGHQELLVWLSAPVAGQ